MAKPGSGDHGWPRILIIGAGLCGIAMAVKLKQAGIENFEIAEAEAGVGGTWRINTYPGAAVDIPSAIFQYSFKPHAWRRTHATQAELLEYLEETASQFGILERCRFNVVVDEVHWMDDDHCYQVTFRGGSTARYEIVISAVGFLNVPNRPSWPGLDKFTGRVFHTAEWDHDVELAGKRVAVVGVGSSSAQVVPAIQPVVGTLYLFQREPGWVLPKYERTYDDREFIERSQPAAQRKEFRRLWWRMKRSEIGAAPYVANSRRNRISEADARTYIAREFADRPDLQASMTPNYVFSGKRRVLADDFYATLKSPNVKVIPRAVSSISARGIVDAAGEETPVDVIITATGFTASSYLARLNVSGRNGVALADIWSEGAFAFIGMTVPDIPNFYMLYGPNTNGAGVSSTFSLAESEAGAIVRDIRAMMRRGYVEIDSRPRVVAAYNSWLQRRLRKTAWARANNYMKNSSGRIVTQFHGSTNLRWVLLHAVRPFGLKGRRAVPSRALSHDPSHPAHLDAPELVTSDTPDSVQSAKRQRV